MTGRRSHGRLSALNGVVHQGIDALLAVGSETGCLINSERCKHRPSTTVPSRFAGSDTHWPPP